jgi:hypothetical protein
LGARYSASLQIVVDFFDRDREQTLPLLTTGFSTTDGSAPYRIWGDSSPQRYLCEGDIHVVPHDHCPKCWGYWDFKCEHPRCPSCGLTLGHGCKVLLDSDRLATAKKKREIALFKRARLWRRCGELQEFVNAVRQHPGAFHGRDWNSLPSPIISETLATSRETRFPRPAREAETIISGQFEVWSPGRIAKMPLETHPDWWNFELELSPHVEERMIDRGFSEVDLRLMIETTAAIRRGGAKGRWILETAHDGDAWEIVVEPDERDQVIVVITAYRVTQ